LARGLGAQALQGLQSEGLVRREQGHGTFVKTRARVRLPDRMTFSIMQLIEPSTPIRMAIQRSGRIKGLSIVHEMMGLPRGAELFYFVRIYSLHAQPIGGAKVHMPIALGDRLRANDLATRNVLRTIAARNGLHLSSQQLVAFLQPHKHDHGAAASLPPKGTTSVLS